MSLGTVPIGYRRSPCGPSGGGNVGRRARGGAARIYICLKTKKKQAQKDERPFLPPTHSYGTAS
jgi:hypothetical protein